MRRLFRITFYLSVTVFFVGVAVLGFTQTRYFRAYLRNVILTTYPEYVNGTIQFERLEGNLITGVQIYNVVLEKDSAVVLSAERIEVRYDPSGLLFDRIPLARAMIVNPRIHIWRSVDGSWSIGQMVKARPVDTLSSATVIDIKSLELVNARLWFVDSLTLTSRLEQSVQAPPEGVVDYALIDLESVNLEAAVTLEPHKIAAQIRKLSGEERSVNIRLARVTADFELTSSEARMNDLVIETKNSILKISFQVRNIDLTKVKNLAELESAPLHLFIDAQKVDAKELRRFVSPHLDFLDRTFSLQTKAAGTFRKLAIDRFLLHTPRSVVQAHGTISSIHEPGNIEFELAFNENKLDPVDIQELLPGLNLPKLDHFGEATYNLMFSGSPSNFVVNLNGETAAGGFQLDGSLKIQQSLVYNGTLQLRGVDLGMVAQQNDIRAQINGKVTINGVGTDVRTMRAVARMEIDSSSVFDMPMDRSIFVLDIGDGILRSHMATKVGQSNSEVTGTFQFLKDSTTYRVSGKVTSLDLARLVGSPLYESDLTFNLAAHGSWLDEKRARSSATMDFLHSSFKKQPFDSGKVRIYYDSQDTLSQSLQITSDVADVLVNGQFSVGTFVSNLRAGGEIISNAISHRVRNLDSLRAFEPFRTPSVAKFQAGVGVTSNPVDVNFKVTVHDAYSLGVLLHQRLTGSFFARGRLAGDVQRMQFSGEMASEKLAYSAESWSTEVEKCQTRWTLGGISRTTIFETFEASADVQAERWSIDKVHLSNVILGMEMKGTGGKYKLSVLVDSTANIQLSGLLTDRGGLYHLDLSEARMGFGSYVYENSDPIILAVGLDGFQFKSFSLRHEAEELAATGHYNPAGVSDLDVSVRGFLLNNLQKMIPSSWLPQATKDVGGIVSGRFLLRGTMQHPNVSLDIVADGVRSGGTVLGQIESRMSYFEHLLTLYMSYRFDPQDAASVPDMLLTGSLPYELALGPAHHHQPKGKIDLTLQSKGVRMDLLGPFIPVVSNLSGFMVCDMKMRGDIDSPEYDGYLSLSGVRFLFTPLNIHYILDGRFFSDKQNIVLQDLRLRNIPQDQSLGEGLVNLSGSFTLDGLMLGEFDLLANGQLLLMKEIARPQGSKFYGDLFAVTGPSGVRWNGTPAKSNLTGEVFVKNGRLTLPPERETVILESRNIAIVFKDDTSKVVSFEPTPSVLETNPGSLLAMNNAARLLDGSSANSSSGNIRTQEKEASGPKSFLDNIMYDLVIETKGPTQLRLIFSLVPSEELFAELTGRLAFEKDGPQARLTGEVEVGNRSYYNYLKRFEATGKLLFTGDPLNPELNIQGKYEGLHRSTPQLGTLADSTVEQKVLVTLDITGSRKEPKLKFGLEEDQNGKYKKREGDVESDAIAFLINGQFRDELTSDQKSALVSNLIGITSGVLTGPLRELVRKETGVSLDVLYYGGESFGQSADIRLSGEIGDAVVRFGGRVFNNINNTNVSVELPMSSVLGAESWRNLILTLERRVEGLENIEEQRPSKGARLLYRINF